MHARTNNTCVFVRTYANIRDREIAHTRAGLFPSSTGRLSTDCSYRMTIRFLNISIMVFLFTSPQRSLVSSDLPPVCIRKERLYRPAHSWYLISLQALGANPTTFVLPVSPLGACVCACVRVCTDMHICSWQPYTGCFPWFALYKKGTGPWPIAGSIAQLPTSAPTLFSRNFILHFYFKCIFTPTVSLTVQRPQFPGAPVLLTMGGHSPWNLATKALGDRKKIQNLPFFFAYFQQIAGIFKKNNPKHEQRALLKILVLN